MTLAIRYALFAALATLANIASQALSLQLLAGRHELWLAMGVGTGVGLVTKYLLDKRWIFAYVTEDIGEDFRKFSLYTLMGVATTALFWATELAFHHVLQADWAKYLGAVLGLGLGYLAKYQLDKRFVFVRST
jgi:putative flippase GtrA